MISLVLVWIISPLLVFLVWRSTKIRYSITSGLPRGPDGLPLVGNLLQIGRKPHLAFAKWAEEYGDLFTIRIANKKALVVNDVKLMRELFSHPSATGNFETEVFQLVAKGPYGIINTAGKAWQEQRQFCVDNLKHFGFGKSAMEPLILNEVREVVDCIEQEMRENGKVSVNYIFRVAVNNALWTITGGERISLKNEFFRELNTDLMAGLQKSVQSGVFFLPWIKYIAPNLSGFNWLVKRSQDLHDFILQVFREHEKSVIPGSSRDLIDCYINKIYGTSDSNSSFYGQVGERHAITAIAEIFVAGGGTLVHHLEWVFLYICRYPEVQAKMQAEIDSVIGANREPSIFDKLRMPYMEAVFLEIFRICSMGPFGVVHRLLEDVPFKGYNLPKGLLLIPNIYFAQHSKSVWTNPGEFLPQRFLSEDGLTVLHRDRVIPFQVGLRRCPGEQLAKDVTFLFTARLLQLYNILPDPAQPNLNFEPDVGYGLFAKPFNVVMQTRDI